MIFTFILFPNFILFLFPFPSLSLQALLPHFTPETLPRRYGGECDDEVLDDDSFILTNADFLSKERAPTKEEKEREEREKEREEEEAKETASAGWFW